MEAFNALRLVVRLPWPDCNVPIDELRALMLLAVCDMATIVELMAEMFDVACANPPTLLFRLLILAVSADCPVCNAVTSALVVVNDAFKLDKFSTTGPI